MSLAEDSMPSYMRVRRRYTQQALENWFRRMVREWEESFTEAEITLGRKFYLDDLIREVELTEKDAIIRARDDAGDSYVIVEWPQKRPIVRASIEDLTRGRAIAVAGLYEIDELLADEIPPIPLGPDAAGEVRSVQDSLSGSLVASPPIDFPVEFRPLFLQFTTSEEGLSFQAYWEENEEELMPAFGEDSDTEINPREREMLVRLTGLARRSGFVYRPEREAFLLPDATRAVPFLSDSLSTWEDYFDIELDDEAERLQHGSHHAEVVASLDFEESTGRIAVEWRFRDEDNWLSDEEGERLKRAGSRGIIIPGRGAVKLRTEQILALKDWERFAAENEGQGLPAYLAFSVFFQRRLKVILPETLARWKQSLRQAREEGSGEALSDPAGSVPDFLRPYQKAGVAWMNKLHQAGCHGLLADEMGLGKTVQVLSLICQAAPLNGPSLIVCPASVIPVWQNEVGRFFPGMPVSVLGRGDLKTIKSDTPQIWLASYHQLRRLRSSAGEISWRYVVLDEAQTIKNPTAKVALTCYALKAEKRIVLTGTPLENRATDLWSLFHFLMPGLLGDKAMFERSVDEGGDVFLQSLQQQLAPFILRRTKTAVVRELPEKNEYVLHCPLTDLQKEEYDRLSQQGIERMGANIQAALKSEPLGFLTLLTRLRQVCCDPRLLPWVSDSAPVGGKIQALVEKLEELVQGGHKVVIFSQFTRLLDRVKLALEENFPSLPQHVLTGKSIDRERPVSRFQEEPGAAAMLVSLRAGGTGITLHAADYVFLMDPWWNPAVEQQAVDRVHRIGQEKPVFVYRMISDGTIEARIQKLQVGKRELFRRIVRQTAEAPDAEELLRDLQSLIERKD
jgi:SNF2 family DNA or RNA helicase